MADISFTTTGAHVRKSLFSAAAEAPAFAAAGTPVPTRRLHHPRNGPGS